MAPWIGLHAVARQKHPTFDAHERRGSEPGHGLTALLFVPCALHNIGYGVRAITAKAETTSIGRLQHTVPNMEVQVREITPIQIAVFMLLVGCTLALAVLTERLLLNAVPLGDFRGVVRSVAGIILLYLYAILAYRLFTALYPLLPGEIPAQSRQEFIYHVHLLFFLILFYPIMRSGLMPVPLMSFFYGALGARIGHNSYSAGILYDPLFITLGNNTLLGEGALLVPHAVEGKALAHQPIRLGSNVTIGAYAVVFGGVEIGDGAIVAAGSVVRKGERIGPGEVWGGMPARKLR